MLVVDSSVWIDFFNGAARPAVGRLQQLLDHGDVRIVVPDLVLFEVLRGFRREQDHRLARRLFDSLSIEDTGGAALALVAAWCIENDYALLHRDADFDAFETLRGLRVWRH